MINHVLPGAGKDNFKTGLQPNNPFDELKPPVVCGFHSPPSHTSSGQVNGGVIQN